MKKKLPILALSAMLLVGLASCGNKPSSTTGPNPTTGGGTPTTTAPTTVTPTTETPQPSTSTAEPIIVESVTITGYEDEGLTRLDGTKATLKAEVKGNKDKLKVTWSSSDENLATVKNGTVRFGKVAKSGEVTITATSVDDATKSASVTFTLVHSTIDLDNSRGNLDTSMFMSEGTISTEVEDIAMVYADVYSTKWYVEANITMEEFHETDAYPKFGIMTGTSESGVWNYADDKLLNAFFYVDAMKSNLAKGWTSFNFVTQNELLTDWNWGGQKGAFSVSNDDKVEQGKEFRMGLLRDGIDYYLFTMKGEEIYCYNHIQWTEIAADQPSYAWIGGWATAVTVKDFKALVGDDVDKMYGQVTDLKLSLDSTTLYLNESYTLRVTTNTLNYDRNKLTFTSSDETVATVDKDGKVTAKEKPGNAVITVKYGDIEKEFKVEVTDDAKFKVVLDGKMDDLIWSENAKTNKYTHKLNGDGEHIDFYGSRNSKGFYLFADYWVNAQKSGNVSGNWWENDNFEIRAYDNRGQLISGVNQDPNNLGQAWISGNKTSNFSDFFVSSPVEENGKYHINFEVFYSYEDLNNQRTENLITKDSVIAIVLGANPQSGWVADKGWNTRKFVDMLKVTEDGLFVKIDENLTCPTEDSHIYDAWYTENRATCTKDGNERRDCILCGHSETRVIASTGSSHIIDENNITVTEPATCLKEGKGTSPCTSCGEPVEVVIPMDYDGHTGEYKDGAWTCCHSELEHTIFNDKRAASGGWEDRSTWSDAFTGLEGDFDVEIRYSFVGNLGTTEVNAWRHPLVVITDAANIAEGQAYGDNATFRFDWCGWMNDRNGDGQNIADSQNAGDWFVGDGADFNTEISNIMKGSDVVLRVKRVGNDITLTYQFTAQTNGKVYDTLTQSLTNVHTNKIDISLSAEWSYFTIYYTKHL